jgi:cell division protein FtsL
MKEVISNFKYLEKHRNKMVSFNWKFTLQIFMLRHTRKGLRMKEVIKKLLIMTTIFFIVGVVVGLIIMNTQTQNRLNRANEKVTTQQTKITKLESEVKNLNKRNSILLERTKTNSCYDKSMRELLPDLKKAVSK